MVIGRASCCFISPKELYGNHGPLESSPGTKNDIKNLQINEQVVDRTSFSLVVINGILQHFDEKWLIWDRNAERRLLLEPGFESSLCHLIAMSLNSSEPEFPHLGNRDHYTKLMGAFKIKDVEYSAQYLEHCRHALQGCYGDITEIIII